jgi:NADH:ubiquinone oxidoreductase subunit 4 (subunit M)
MYFKESNDEVTIQDWDITAGFNALLVITAVLIIVLGVYPNLLLDWLHY